MQSITITLPDDYHLHCRDNHFLPLTVPPTAKSFGRAIIMPNLPSPIDTVDKALAYKKRILAVLDSNHAFTPLMTLYLREDMSQAELMKMLDYPDIVACKLYPAGATTHSQAGIQSLEKIYPLLGVMEKNNIPLLIHGEATDPELDIFDREKAFIDRYLKSIIETFPGLRIVFEHITSKEAVDFVKAQSSRIGATITAHHLLYNRNALFHQGLRPHYYCLPILKTEEDRLALLNAATSGDPHFFLGSDSAPHLKNEKESACCPAGIFTGLATIAYYAMAFDQVGKIEKLENFASHFGADFYGLPRNTKKITLEKTKWQLPATLSAENITLIPFMAGETLNWKQKEVPADVI